MSIYEGIVNPNTIIREQFKTSPTSAGCALIAASTIKCPANIILKNITIHSSEDMVGKHAGIAVFEGTLSPIDKTNPVYTSVLFNNQSTASLDLNVHIENPYNVNALQIGLYPIDPFVLGTVFDITVDYIKALPSSLTAIDSTPYKESSNFRILRWDSVNQTMIDLTNQLKNNIPASDQISNTNTLLNDDNDAIYIGSTENINALFADVDVTGVQDMDVDFDITYLKNDNSWATYTITNESVSSAQTANSLFEYSGIIQIPSSIWATALRTQLTAVLTTIPKCSDPLYDYQKAIEDGNAYPIGMFYNPSRYWLRLKIANNAQYPLNLNALKLLK